MLDLARQKNAYVRKPVAKAEAINYFNEKGDPYKLDLLEGLEDGTITFYSQGNFVDLCRGPHIPDTGNIKAAKLLNVAGAYWRGDVNSKQLTRIYAITFPKQKELTDYLTLIEEAKKRDHRKIGKEMELFTFSRRWAWACRCGCPRVLCCANGSKISCARPRCGPATCPW
jgi:threonyl-tRNA synthetase